MAINFHKVKSNLIFYFTFLSQYLHKVILEALLLHLADMQFHILRC